MQTVPITAGRWQTHCEYAIQLEWPATNGHPNRRNYLRFRLDQAWGRQLAALQKQIGHAAHDQIELPERKRPLRRAAGTALGSKAGAPVRSRAHLHPRHRLGEPGYRHGEHDLPKCGGKRHRDEVAVLIYRANRFNSARLFILSPEKFQSRQTSPTIGVEVLPRATFTAALSTI